MHAVSAWPAPVSISRRWRGNRSASAPAGTPTKKSGSARMPIATPTRNGESVSSRVSQPSTTTSPIIPTEFSSTDSPRQPEVAEAEERELEEQRQPRAAGARRISATAAA